MPGPSIYDYRMIFHKVGGYEVAFEIANEDNTESDVQYYGYLSSFGSWIIQKRSVIGSTSQYTYAAGKSRDDYDGYWNVGTGVYEGDATFTTFDQLGDSL